MTCLKAWFMYRNRRLYKHVHVQHRNRKGVSRYRSEFMYNMGKVESFVISLDDPLATYYPGQTVSGKVTLKLNESLSHKGIFFRFKGTARVSWTESNSDNGSDSYIDTQTYFDVEIPLLQKPERDEKMKLQAGLHEYTFSQVLPSDLPTTVEGVTGHIRYTCSSYISRPWKLDPKCKVAFSVVELVDLNVIPGMDLPISIHESKDVGKLFWKSGSISASVTLNKRGYVPGEMIYINAEVNNSTSGRVNRTTASLICLITCRVRSYTNVQRIVIATVKRGVVEPHSCDPWMGESIQIPPTYPTRVPSDGLCRVMSCDYFIEFSVVPSAVSRDLVFKIPLTIGSVPLVSDFSKFTQKPPVDYPFGDQGFRPPMLNIYPNLPPPSYEESYRGRVTIKQEGDRPTICDVSYIPHYHYYT